MAAAPDGGLFLGVGTGAAGSDDVVAQRLDQPLGKVVRLAPSDLIGPELGPAEMLPRVAAIGLRNPYSLSSDPANGVVWIGDVGDTGWEEIDMLEVDASGITNFGWPYLEGPTQMLEAPEGFRAEGPALAYAHEAGRCAIVLGPRVPTGAIEGLKGALLFVDFCSNQLFAVAVGPGGTIGDPVVIAEAPAPLVSLGLGPFGEVYVGDVTGSLYRLDPESWTADDVDPLAGVYPVSTTSEVQPLDDGSVDARACGIPEALGALPDVGQSGVPDRSDVFAGIESAVDQRVAHLPAPLASEGEALLDAVAEAREVLEAGEWSDASVLEVSDRISSRTGAFGDGALALDVIGAALSGRCG